MSTYTTSNSPENVSSRARKPQARQFIVPVLITLAMLFVPFLAAGTLRWPMAWVYVAVTIGGSVVSRILMARAHPDLIAERAGFIGNEGVKSWDKAIVPLLVVVGPLFISLVAGLDRRYDWPPQVSLMAQIVAVGLCLLGYVLSTWAMIANRFFSSVVRIQRERGHTVVDTGPYRFVRHPGYAAAALCMLSMPLMLGSFWALMPGALTAVLYAVRTALEDRTLQAELEGYRKYAARVPYRLLPGVW